MQKIDPNSDSRELFLTDLHDQGFGKLVSIISRELTNDMTNGEIINKILRMVG